LGFLTTCRALARSWNIVFVSRRKSSMGVFETILRQPENTEQEDSEQEDSGWGFVAHQRVNFEEK
jgi:hypothetical protein